MDAGDAGTTLSIADTHAESAFFGELCVARGFKHRGFVSKRDAFSVRLMENQLFKSEQRNVNIVLSFNHIQCSSNKLCCLNTVWNNVLERLEKQELGELVQHGLPKCITVNLGADPVRCLTTIVFF